VASDDGGLTDDLVVELGPDEPEPQPDPEPDDSE
jgi:hypothetical protein